MEFINKIELQGTVGSAKVTTVGESKLVRFSLCTHQAYNDSSEAIVVECTWFNCIAWEGEKIKDVSQIKSNDIVHLKGRVRAHSYTNASGNDKYVWEVLCQEIEVFSNQE